MRRRRGARTRPMVQSSFRPLAAFVLAGLAAVCALACAVGTPVAAQTLGTTVRGTTTWTEAPLADVLYEFGDRSGLTLVFAVRVVRDARVSGRYTAGEDVGVALQRLLGGTGVLAQMLRPGQYVLIAAPLSVTLGVEDGPEAYTGTLDGRVVDAETGEPLVGASVFLVDVQLGAVADADGGFAIEALPAGRYTARVTYVGYRAVRVALDVFPLSPRRPAVVRLQSEPVASVPAEVRAPPDAGPMPGVTDVAARGVARVLSPVGRGDLAAALAALPGLSRTGGGGGRLVVRGADPDALRVLRDGVPVYEPWHAGGLVSTLQPEALGRVRLHRGQFPAGLGGGLAAILETETSSALAGDTSVVAALSPVAARATADVAVGRSVSVHLAGLRSTLGTALLPGVRVVDGVWAVDPLGGRAGDTLRPDVQFASGEAAVAVRLSAATRLDVAAWATRDRLRIEGVGGGLAETVAVRDGSSAATARLRGLVGQRTFASALVYTTRVASEADLAGVLDYTSEALTETAAALDVDRALGLRHTLGVGARIASRTVEGAFERGDARVEDRRRGSEVAAFVADTWSPGLGWQVQAGLRAESTRGQARASASVSPRLFVRWSRERLVVRAGVSRQTQAVQRLVRVAGALSTVAPRWAVAGPDGPAAAAWQAGLGMEWAPTARVAVGVDVYGRLDRGVLRPDGSAADPSVRMGGFVRHRGRSAGIDIAARYAGDLWTVSFAGAVALAETLAPGRLWRSAPYARPLTAGLLVERAVGPAGVGVRLDAGSGLSQRIRPGADREPADVRLALAVGVAARPFGLTIDALALAHVRLVGASGGAEVDAGTRLPLAFDARALPAVPTLSVSVRW